MQITPELQKLFKQVRTVIGGGIRRVELDDNALCDLLDIAIGEYAELVQNFIIESNWLNIQNTQISQYNNFNVDAAGMAYALTRRTMNWSKEYSFWFSAEIGLQQRGSYELKKDFITIEKGKQCYVVPAGREINKVMWVTPSTTQAAMYGIGGLFDTGFGGGVAQLGNMGYGMGMGTGFYIGNTYDVTLYATQLKNMNSLFRGDLAYHVTAGPNGTHIIHLLSTPGSPRTFGGMALDDQTYAWNKYQGCQVWYTYYEVDTTDSEAVAACINENKDDVIITPDQVPLDEMSYELLNNAAQQTVKQLLIAEAMRTIGLIRGYASGKISIPQAEMQLDYNMLLSESKEIKSRALDNLKERLQRMLPWEQMKNQVELNDNLKKVLDNKPLPYVVR